MALQLEDASGVERKNHPSGACIVQETALLLDPSIHSLSPP